MNVQLDVGAFVPEQAHKTDAGYDLRSPISCLIPAHDSVVIDTGVHVEVPHDYCLLLVSKSGLNVKHGITGTGLIDEGYAGSVRVKLYNNSDVNYYIHTGDKICQFVVIPCLHEAVHIVNEIKAGERGNNGFGSTGQ